MSSRFEHLGEFSDWVAHAQAQAELYPADAAPLTSQEVRRLIGFPGPGRALDPKVERRWTRDGVAGEEVSWSVGYGPRTVGWVLRPEGHEGPLPGVLALHGHDGFKYLGKEKIADGPDRTPAVLAELREAMYGGRAFANELARRGFTVLCHDVFLWGSRRFAPRLIRPAPRPEPEARWLGPDENTPSWGDPVSYNRAALAHEHTAAKYATLLGTTLAGVVSYEDRCAADYLRTRPDVASGPLGCVGLSGGGCRAALLQATCDDLGAAVVVGMMSTHPALLDRHVANHTWMFFPPGLAGRGDWPDVAAARAPSPLLVQYCRDDELFPLAGMRAADERLARRYQEAGAPHAYVGEFFDGGHRFEVQMQDAAFAYLAAWLRS